MAAKHDGSASSGRSAQMGWKLASLLAGVLGAKVARSATQGTWKKAVGRNPPANPLAGEASWGDAVAWAALSGAAVGVTRVLGQQGAAGMWKRATGSPPPGFEKMATH